MRRGAAYRLVRARTLRNEESKMCHTSRVAWYKLTSARVCFGAALCFIVMSARAAHEKPAVLIQVAGIACACVTVSLLLLQQVCVR